MKRMTLTDLTAVMKNPTGIHRYFGWPTLAKKQDGTLVCAASGFRLEHLCPFGKLCLSLSKNEGKTWEYATVTDDAFSWDLGYPAVTELPSGEVYMVWYQKEPTGESRILGGIWDPYE